ncbi:MAG: hypothetical protein QM778_03295 [Myxococcales bacterium]
MSTALLRSRARGRASTKTLVACVLALGLGACSKSVQLGANSPASPGLKDARTAGRSKPMVSGGEGDLSALVKKCEGGDARHEVSEYDTSGDDLPDVRKVFLRVGDGTLARLVLVCRESDLNSDGAKDVIRYYTDEGRPLREEADRNFDGVMDEITIFQEGMIQRQEFDSQGDGKVDTKIFFDDGKPLRAERDLKARSTPEKWTPDRWEYFEEGRVVRMGTDVDGDGTVDRWDRDSSIRRGVDVNESSPASSEPS